MITLVLLRIILLVFLVAANAFFVAAEFAMVSVRDTRIQQLIEQLRNEGRAIKTQVVLNYTVVGSTGDTANVIDHFEDNSIYVKIGTEDPLTTSTADQLFVLYRLRKFPGTWKVIDSVRSE